MTQEEQLKIQAKAYDGNYKTYTELINRLEGIKDAIKKQNYGIAMDILCKPYPEFQITTSTELKESEDERIRKKIIATIHLYYGEPLEDEAKEMTAWLEKQGEHANFINKIQIGDEVTRNKDGVLVNLSQLKRVAKKDEKQGEQKDVNIQINPSEYINDMGGNGCYLKNTSQKSADKVIEEEKPLLEKFKQAVYDCAWGKVTCKVEGETKEEYANRWAEQFLLIVRDWADDYIDFTIQQKLRNSYEKGKTDVIEKQGEQKPTLPKWKYKKDHTPLLRDSIILNKYGCVAKSPSGALVSDVWVIDYDELAKLPKEEFEEQSEQKPAEENNITGIGSKHAQGKLGEMIKNQNHVNEVFEQKPADKIEPKFHEGEWVVYECGEETVTLQITRIVGETYVFSDDSTLGVVDEDTLRLWDVAKDAKDGDVLCSGQLIILFKQWEDNTDWNFVIAHAGIDISGKLQITDGHWLISNKSKPATKEQRDTLERAMSNAGYTFDFEKKELKKIEQKPAWSEEDEYYRNIIMYCLNGESVGNADKENAVSWFKSLKYRVQPKQEWSEEDKRKIDRIYSILLEAADTHAFSTTCRLIGDKECVELQDFLKSLRPQNTWKPSKEMLEALYRATPENVMEKSEDEMLLDKLYQGLKYGRVLSKK